MSAVVFLNTSKEYGGVEKNFFLRAKLLQREGKEVDVIVADRAIYTIAEEQEIKNLYFFTCFGDYDIFFLFRFYFFLRKRKAKVIFLSTKRDYWRGGIPAKAAGLEKIIGYWGFDYSFKNRVKSFIVFRYLLDLLIVNSKELAAIFKKRSFPFNPTKIRVIYNSVEAVPASGIRTLNLREEYNIPREAVVLGTAGRLVPSKNLHSGIEIIKSLQSTGSNNAFLFIAGTGNEQENLEKFAKELSLERQVIFIGNVERLSQTSFYSELDIFLFFGGKREGLPNVILEALCQNTIVVSAAATGAAEIITESFLGKIVTGVEEMKEVVEQIVRNGQYAKDASRSEYVLSKFSPQKMVESTLQLFYKD